MRGVSFRGLFGVTSVKVRGWWWWIGISENLLTGKAVIGWLTQVSRVDGRPIAQILLAMLISFVIVARRSGVVANVLVVDRRLNSAVSRSQFGPNRGLGPGKGGRSRAGARPRP
jgi:hypothetical protein